MPYELLEDTLPEVEEPGFLEETRRNIGRTGLRVAEQLAGTPGDLLSLIHDYIANPISEAITGKKQTPYTESKAKIFPTSEEVKAHSEKIIGEKAKPQNNLEQFSDDVFTTAASIFAPGPKGKGLKSLAAPFFKSLGAHTAGEAVKDLTGDEKKAAYTNLGALTLLSFIDKKGAAKAISEGYKPLAAKVETLSPVSTTSLEKSLGGLKSKMLKGTQAPSEKFIIDEVDAVLNKINKGTITPEELWASKRSLNEKLSETLYKFPKKETQQRARQLSSVISHGLDDALALTKSQDPSFYKELKAWNRAYKTMADSNFLSKWVENKVKYTPMTAGLLHLFGSSTGSLLSPVASTAATALVPYQIGKLAYRIQKSPKLRSLYAKSLAMAGAEDAIEFNRQLKSLDKEIQKEEKRDEWELID